MNSLLKTWLRSVVVVPRRASRPRSLRRASAPTVFRDFQRPEGARGSAMRPEYRVDQIWAGRVVDELFTFDAGRIEDLVRSTIADEYDVAVWTREDGDWGLIFEEKR